MHLEWQDLLKAHEGLEARLDELPDGVFSGKPHPKPGTKAVFFCYARPGFDKQASADTGEDTWNAQSGDVKWYLYDLATEPSSRRRRRLSTCIRSEPKTRARPKWTEVLSDIRQAVEKHIAKTTCGRFRRRSA